MTDINLIPQQEKQEQKKAQVVRVSTVVAIALFSISAIAGVLMFVRNSEIKSEVTTHSNAVEELRSRISGMSEVEISARNLDKRYSTLKGIFDTRNHYSILLREFNKRIPSTVEITTFAFGKGTSLNVSGEGVDYLAIAKFISDLSNREYEGSGEGLGGLFTNITLNSVNLDSQTSKARFYIVVNYNQNLLEK